MMPNNFDQLRDMTLTTRKTQLKLLKSFANHVSEVPAGWNNNAYWQAGHLIITPHLLTFKQQGIPLIHSEDFVAQFCKGSSPRDWKESDEVMPFEFIVDIFVSDIESVFDAVKDTWEEPYAQPYTTSVGVTLTNPATALNFNLFHEGIHLGSLLALRRALGIV